MTLDTHDLHAPVVEVGMTLDALLAALRTQGQVGSFFLPVPVDFDAFELTIVLGPVRYLGQRCRRIQSDTRGTWLHLSPTEELEALLACTRGPRRPALASLEVCFSSLTDLAARWEADISIGRLFVKSAADVAVGDRLDVEFVLMGSALARATGRVLLKTPDGFGLRFEAEYQQSLAQLEGLVLRYRQRPRHVLVVDDEPLWRQCLSRVLTPSGIVVRSAADGHWGLADLTTHLFGTNLVITDWRMPHLGGPELARRAHRMGRANELKFILLTGAASDSLRAVETKLFSRVLSKSSSIDQIAEAVLETLKN
jgi:CheY-like chemotaxis protein